MSMRVREEKTPIGSDHRPESSAGLTFAEAVSGRRSVQRICTARQSGRQPSITFNVWQRMNGWISSRQKFRNDGKTPNSTVIRILRAFWREAGRALSQYVTAICSHELECVQSERTTQSESQATLQAALRWTIRSAPLPTMRPRKRRRVGEPFQDFDQPGKHDIRGIVAAIQERRKVGDPGSRPNVWEPPSP